MEALERGERVGGPNTNHRKRMQALPFSILTVLRTLYGGVHHYY